MPLDPSIPLQTRAPTFEQPDFAGTIMNAAKIKSAQLDMASKQNEEEYKLLASATPDNYEQVKQYALQKYGGDALKFLPPTYDKQALDSLAMSRLDIKDKIALQQQKLEMDLNREKFGEEKRHNLASEDIDRTKANNPFGNSLQGKAYNILLGGDPNSPEYALAANAATQPKYQSVVNADGTTQLVAVTPQLPSIIRQPGAPNPTDNPKMLTPPPMNGMTDNTPTTAGPLLPPPGREYSVSPIAGTAGPAKLTDEQTKAAGFAQRMESSNGTINDLQKSGYTPKMGTDTLAEAPGGNYLLGADAQQSVQAKRDFVNALLRRESGAAISESEFANANKQYFPQPGDKPETLAKKAANRANAIAGIKLSAGPAYKRMQENNPSPALDSLPQGAKQIGTSGGKPVYQTPDGKHFMAQ